MMFARPYQTPASAASRPPLRKRSTECGTRWRTSRTHRDSSLTESQGALTPRPKSDERNPTVEPELYRMESQARGGSSAR